MAMVEVAERGSPVIADRGLTIPRTGLSRDLQRTFQLILATIWLLDAVLQIQPFMFTRGSSGFSGMLNGLASGNPELGVPHHHVERIDRLPPPDPDQSVLRPHPVRDRFWHRLEEIVQAGAGALHRLGPGSLVVRRRVGRDLPGRGHSVRRRSRWCALLCRARSLLWPSEGSNKPFVAARTVGLKAARGIWVGSGDFWRCFRWWVPDARRRRCMTWWPD